MHEDGPLENFAVDMVEIRDTTIDSVVFMTEPSYKGPRRERWRNALEGADVDEIRRVLVDVVDETIFHVLDAIDNGQLKLYVVDGNTPGTFRRLADLASEPLAWSFVGDDDGWRSTLSIWPRNPFGRSEAHKSD